MQAGVGFMTSSQNSQLVTNEYLRAREIIPDSWEVSNLQASPQIFQSQITYGNGIMFYQNGNLLRIVEFCNSGFQDDYIVYELANTFLEKADGDFIGCGVDLDMWAYDDDPTSWIANRFSMQNESAFLQGISNISLDFSFEMEDQFEGGSLQISLGSAKLNSPESGVKNILDAKGLTQFSNEKPSKLSERMRQWRDLHEIILQKVNLVLGGEQ
ncbi:MAG: hypothetical protein OXI59_14830 [Gemmatimonadota bacterium]|nr:hypothetical protein [Gemmatimonadota bacterium]